MDLPFPFPPPDGPPGEPRDAVDAREHDVEESEVGFFFPENAQGIFARRGGEHFKAFLMQPA